MSGDLYHVRAAIGSALWAIEPAYLATIVELVERRAAGIYLSADEIAAIKFRPPNGSYLAMDAAGRDVQRGASGPQSTLAVINIMGVIAQHASQVDNISGPGGTSTERVSASLRTALADPSIRAIVLNIDSPGGNTSGVPELAAQIYAARGQKPIVAQVNSRAASAAYWLASAAGEIAVTPSGDLGSIGVYTVHQDISKAADRQGIKTTFISAGKYKTERNAFAPLGEEAAQALQSRVDEAYRMFSSDIAKGRNVSVDRVRGGFGQGRIVSAQAAVREGMADRVATLDQTLRRLGVAPAQTAGSKAIALASGARIVSRADVGDARRRRHAHRLRNL